MKILDTAKRRQKAEARKDLRKAIKHTLDNVEVDEAWKALGESLQNAMDALGLGPGDDPHDATDSEFADTIMLATAAIEVREKQAHPLFLIRVDDVDEEEEFLAPGQVYWLSEPEYVGKFPHNFSMGCSIAPTPCPFCDGDEECDC